MYTQVIRFYTKPIMFINVYPRDGSYETCFTHIVEILKEYVNEIRRTHSIFPTKCNPIPVSPPYQTQRGLECVCLSRWLYNFVSCV